MDRITVRGKGGNVYLTGYADVCWGGRPVRARAFCTGCHGAKDNRDVDRSKCGPLILIDRLAAYEDAMPLERAQELAQAEQDGRLIALPYKTGDLVYRIAVRKKYINRSMCTPYIKVIKITTENAHKYKDEIGKTVFLTREEAEVALKKREADNETD